ncbi:hypothetical protein KL927_003496 [Ogataea polymorpha]|nr:hypothetical protein KL927_003496 [Ogataea polymorpha]
MEDVKTIVETLRSDPQRGLQELECRLESRRASEGGMVLGPDAAVRPENWQVVVDELLEMLVVPEKQWTWFRPTEPREQKTLRQHKQVQLHALRQVLQSVSEYDRHKLLDRVSLYYDERVPWSSKESAQAVQDILRRVEPSKDEIFVLMDGYVPMLREFGKVSQHRTKVSASGYRKSQNAADGSVDTPLVGRAPVGEDDRIRTKYMSRIGSLAFLVDFLQGSDIEARWNVIFLLLLHYLDDHDVHVKSAACKVLQTVVAKVTSRPSTKNIIARSNVAGLLLDTIAPCLLALPTLTPPEESRTVLPTAVSGGVQGVAGGSGNGAAAENGGVRRRGGEADVLRRARAAAKPVHRVFASDDRRGGRGAGAIGGARTRAGERALRRAGVSSEGGTAAAQVRGPRCGRGASENRPLCFAARADTTRKRPRTKISSPNDTVKTRRMPKFLTQSRDALREKYVEINRREKSRLVDAMRHKAQSEWSYEAGARNGDRNRYSDVLPFDKNRVRLGSADNDYINASWIELTCGDGVGRYIATQGPTAATWRHFWQMCFEQCVEEVVIVMLTPLFESGREKCYKYWSENDFRAGDWLVLEFGGMRESESGHFTVRHWTLRDEASGALKPVTQYQFHEWADFSAPEQATSLVELSSSVHSHNTRDPIVVHCSAGVGRSGTFIAVDYFLQHCTAALTAPGTDDAREDLITPVNNHEVRDPVLEIVLELRSQRVLMVQQFEQFAFIYDCLRRYYIGRYLNKT